MNVKSNKLNKQGSKEITQDWLLKFIPILALFLKLVIASNIKGTNGMTLGAWLGADGESYLKGVDGLLTAGYFSDQAELSFWPAGYPVLIWLLCKISLANFAFLITIVQSALYAFGCYFFVNRFRGTKLNKIMVFIALLLAFNPTLSLSSLVIGYESPIASCMLLTTGLILKLWDKKPDSRFVYLTLSVGVLFAVCTFIQPRWILTTFVVVLFWALSQQNRRSQALILSLVIGTMSLAPAILIHRNHVSIGKSVISTNLGATMKIGAGDSTSGGYLHTGPDVPCEPLSPGGAVTDNRLVKCVLAWYLENPVKTIVLFAKKSWYFWSPWSGTLANGTMARNPWLKVDPILSIAKSNELGNTLINGLVGQTASALWVLTTVALMFIGFFWLYSQSGFYRTTAYLAFLPILVSWVVSIGTIGDHRFRIPTMGLSLFLQAVGAFWIWHRLVKDPHHTSKPHA
jgi:hypothetical protein